MKPFRIAQPNLLQIVKPLITELTLAYDQRLHPPTACDLTGVKFIPATFPFFVYNSKIFRHASHRGPRPPKANKLWMLSVSFRQPPQDRLCQQRFTPKCRESSRVQVFRMQCPESQSFLIRNVRPTLRLSCGPIGRRAGEPSASDESRRNAEGYDRWRAS